jgi:hypothetical protein
VALVVDRVALGQVFPSEYFGFPLSVSFDECSILIFIVKLVLQKEKMGEAWKTSKSDVTSQIGEH